MINMAGEGNETGTTKRMRKRKPIDIDAYEEEVPVGTVEKGLTDTTDTELKDTVNT